MCLLNDLAEITAIKLAYCWVKHGFGATVNFEIAKVCKDNDSRLLQILLNLLTQPCPVCPKCTVSPEVIPPPPAEPETKYTSIGLKCNSTTTQIVFYLFRFQHLVIATKSMLSSSQK
jgi:hypothetical protein